MDEERLDRAIIIFKALSDSNRLRIFTQLMNGDSCNCELQDRLGLAPNLLSHHLKVLEGAGLIKSRRDVIDGRWIYYSADEVAISEWRRWFVEFFDPDRIQTRSLCGPEGQLVPTSRLHLDNPR
jgi:ArsR family transcriptional regulator